MWLKQKNLYERPRCLAEMKACLYHLGIIEHHQGSGRQVVCDVVENIFADIPVAIDKQLAVVALCNGEFGDTLVGESLIIIVDFYMFCFHINFLLKNIQRPDNAIKNGQYQNEQYHIDIGQTVS